MRYGMHRPKTRVVWIALIISLFFFRGAEAAGVRWVPDGDTLVLVGGETVRLQGIDAPEVARDDRPSQYYAVISRAVLQKAVRGKNVTVHKAQAGRDRYGRLLARVSLKDGTGLSRFMVEQGAAFAYPHPDQLDADLMRELLVLQRRAIRQGAGFWPRVLAVSNQESGWVGNGRSKRFHRLSCRYGKRIGKRNRVSFLSLRDAFEAGFAPCRKCTPWPVHK